MSIAEEEREINEVLGSSKKRLAVVEDKLRLLGDEKKSIDQDIGILTNRLQAIQRGLAGKKEAYGAICRLAGESEEAYRKLKESTKTLLVAFKKDQKKIDALFREHIHQ